jgi:hypothetical protein
LTSILDRVQPFLRDWSAMGKSNCSDTLISRAMLATAKEKNDENTVSRNSLIDSIEGATTPRGLCALSVQRHALGMSEHIARIEG